MIRINEAIIVEGKYDKIKLSSVVESVIIDVGGFRIFKDSATMNMIRGLARARGIIILTDSDSAGFLIRGYLGGSIPDGCVKHAYIPDMYGKERRKDKPSAEGKLGVEGVPSDVIVSTLLRAGATEQTSEKVLRRITPADLYEDGLSGRSDSRSRRKAFATLLGYPERISTSALIRVLNSTMTYEDYKILAGSSGR